MTRVKIKRLEPIREADAKLGNVTVFAGPQAGSGSPTALK